MTHEWEAEAKSLIRAMQDLTPDHLEIVGVAFENVDCGEGALVEVNCLEANLHEVSEADVRHDILCDAKRQYDRTYRGVFGGIEERAK